MNRQGTSPLWLKGMAFSVSVVLGAVFTFIIGSALFALWAGKAFHLLSPVWAPSRGMFGVLPMVYGSLLLSTTALCLGWTLALGCACMMRSVAPRWLRRCLMGALRFMTAIPTVVYGFASVFLLVPLIRDMLGGAGFSLLAAAVVLALQGVPAMALVMDASMSAVEQQTALTTAALGMTPLQALSWVVLPKARGGLVAAGTLGFGRAVGDTLLPVMLAGNAVQFAVSPLDSLRTLTAHIGLVLASDVGGAENLSLLLSGGILLTLSSCVNLFARALLRRAHRETA